VNTIAYSRRCAALCALLAVAACSGGSHAVPLASTPVNAGGSAAATSSAVVQSLHPSTAFTSSTTLIGPATTVNTVVLHVVPNLQNAAGLAQYAQEASDPSSGLYRRFLAPADIAARFGATSADYAAVANYFASYGLKVGGWPQRLALTVAGPRTSFEKALGTTFSFYRGKTGHTLLAPTNAVTFSRALPVSSIADAVLDPQSKWLNVAKPEVGPNQGLLSGLAPQQIATAFDYASAYNAGYTGSGITIGIIGTGPAMAVDFNTYKSQYAFTGASTLTFPAVSAAAAANAGGSPTGTPPAVTGPCSTSNSPYVPPSESPTPSCNPEDGEAQIDTEQAALARDAKIEFYLAYVPVECGTPNAANCSPDPSTGLGYDYQGLAESDDEIQQIIADNTADVVSGSYGGAEIFQNMGYIANSTTGAYDPSALGPTEFAALAAEGIATFISSGDQGAQGCAAFANSLNIASQQCTSYPSTDTNVTAVGGVTLPLDNAGVPIGPIDGWGQQTFGDGIYGGASGGGTSCYVPLPPWQVQASAYSSISLSAIAASNGCSPIPGVLAAGGGGRLVPDVSLEGDPETGVAFVANVAFGESTSPIGGTSVAAPEMAAMWAIVLQACAKTSSCATAGGAKPYRLGNAAKLLWTKVYQSATLYPQTIYDVTFGNNGTEPCSVDSNFSCTATPPPGYSAGAGWDPVTGLGAPFARHLITAIVGI
jgi:subtilase family serine protease